MHLISNFLPFFPLQTQKPQLKFTQTCPIGKTSDSHKVPFPEILLYIHSTNVPQNCIIYQKKLVW